jgi:DNA-directed RNA polymerase specialized sigma subunit
MGQDTSNCSYLIKIRAKRYSRIGLEYDDVFQQASLLFILSVYNYQERSPIAFAGYLKKPGLL